MKIVFMVLFYIAYSSAIFKNQFQFINPIDKTISDSQNLNGIEAFSNIIKAQNHRLINQQNSMQNDIQQQRQSAQNINQRILAQQSKPQQSTKAKSWTQKIKESLAKAQNISLMPVDGQYDAIFYSLFLIIVLFIIIQLISCVCQKKKKRYGQKFQQYIHRSEVQQFEQENWNEK